MASFSQLLERTRVPQPSLQKLAVKSIFEKLRSSPSSGDDSTAATNVIAQCLSSESPAVVDQSVREICLLVKESKLDLSISLLELQSALEGTDSRFASVFVKALGFLARLAFQRDVSSFRFNSSETHPFVKILSCRADIQYELLQQVLIFTTQNKNSRMREVCEFLRPLLNYSIIRISTSASSSSFARNLVSSLASLCCSFPRDAIPVIKLLMRCFKYLPCNNSEDLINVVDLLENTVDAFIVVLRHSVETGLLIHDVQLCGVELLETIFSLGPSLDKCCSGADFIFEMSRRLFIAQRELGLSYVPELSPLMLFLFVSLIHSELEHVQLSILKLLLVLLKWKSDDNIVGTLSELNQERLFILPVINLLLSPSSSVKEVAKELLIILGRNSVNFLVTPKNGWLTREGCPCISRPEHILIRLLQHLWFQLFQDQTIFSVSFYLPWASGGEDDVKEIKLPKTWTSSAVEHSRRISERRKLSLPLSQSQEMFLHEMPMLLGSIASVLVAHHTLWNSAIDLLTVTGNLDPKLGVQLFLVTLFYNDLFSNKYEDDNFSDISLKLLGMLTSLSLHPAMVPFVLQTILPMLHKDTEPVLYATATRLLCKTWETNERAFGSLQEVLLPKGFAQFADERIISISMAASIRDVCRRNPDRGVDLILSVSSCIESKDPLIQSLGFQSLAHLCEADVVDFYTAWGVISKHVLNYSTNPIVAEGLCFLLRCGAMDAEAYPEVARSVLHILWEVQTSRHPGQETLWAKARASAFEALTQFEVPYVLQCLPDLRERSMEMLISETDCEVLGAMERFEMKMIAHEHMTRRRLVKEKRVPVNKIEKLLDVFPQVIGLSGNNSKAKDMPGASLFFLSFTDKDVDCQGASKLKVLQELSDRYENAVVEIAASLQISRNILIAILSLQSWKPFMQSWMRAHMMLHDPKVVSPVVDSTSKAATHILKCVRRIADNSIPRSAENIALAVGALCMVLPASEHVAKSNASKFLLNWLFQYEHEYRQWSAAISLGVISSCMHVTDHEQKIKNINSLLEVTSCSKSTLVRGACGVGLGFSCQDLFTSSESEEDPGLARKTIKMQDTDLLGKIMGTLLQLISPFAVSSLDVLQLLCGYFQQNIDLGLHLQISRNYRDELEEDMWGVSGLVLGLGSSIGAIYRAGFPNAVVEIKNLIVSWIPHVNNHFVQKSATWKKWDTLLAIGSCLALPIIVAFCQRVELIDGAELNRIMSGYGNLIRELLSVKKSGALHQSFMMASCVSAGNIVACVLNEGVHSIGNELVSDLLELFRATYSKPHPPLISLGGIMGIVDAIGAGAGTLFLRSPLTSLHNAYDHKVSSYVMGPLVSSAAMETSLTSLIQEIFLVAQNPDDDQLRHYAAWAISFLRHYTWSNNNVNRDHDFEDVSVDSKFVSQSFPKDSTVLKLSMLLMNLNCSEAQAGINLQVNTVTTLLRCLSHAPRLPSLEWGAIARRCMRYEGQLAQRLSAESALDKGTLREECLMFSIAHGKQFDPLLTFLDELTELSRFRTLEMSLQSCILNHVPKLIKIFSVSRIKKLFDDVANFLEFSVSSDHLYSPEQRSSLRTSSWKALYLCLDESSLDSQEYIFNIEKCMEVLFHLLPESSHSESALGVNHTHIVEWSEAVKCLAKAPQDWVADILEVSEVDFSVGSIQLSAKKKLQARARMVRIDSMALIEMAKVKAYILNARSEAVWDILVDVAAALQTVEGSTKRQWLVDTVEICCVTAYPSTALQFLGLLSGCFSKYMPLLVVDPRSVLSDLPVTLSSLLLENTRWEVVAESVVSLLWTSTERVHKWIAKEDSASDFKGREYIDKGEEETAVFLLRVMHHACVSLKNYLPQDKLLGLANMVLP